MLILHFLQRYNILQHIMLSISCKVYESEMFKAQMYDLILALSLSQVSNASKPEL